MSIQRYVNNVVDTFLNGEISLDEAIDEVIEFGLTCKDCEEIFGEGYMERWYDGEENIYNI